MLDDKYTGDDVRNRKVCNSEVTASPYFSLFTLPLSTRGLMYHFCSTVMKPPQPSGTQMCLFSTGRCGFGFASCSPARLLSPATEVDDNDELLPPSIGFRRGDVATDEALEEGLLLLRRGLAGVWCDGGPGDDPPAPQPEDTPRALSAPNRDPNAAPNDVRRGGSVVVRGSCGCCCGVLVESALCPGAGALGDMGLDW